jgi:hypothetical protein
MAGKRPKKIEDIARGGKGAGYEHYLVKEGDGRPDFLKSFDDLRAEVAGSHEAREETKKEIKKMPRLVTPEVKKELKKRLRHEIFVDSETQEYYLNSVREALETPGVGDRLYDYIVAHPTYGKSKFVSWNSEFNSDVIRLKPEGRFKGKDEKETNMRITAATQIVLVETYKNDVFQLTMKEVNPWIFIDGKMGPYSVSVLAEYWKGRFGPKSKGKKPPEHPTISSSYSDTSRGLYKEATDYLKGKVEETPVPKAEALDNVDPGDQLSEEVAEH